MVAHRALCCWTDQLCLQFVVFKATEQKRYDFVTSSAEYAADIVAALKKGIAPYHDV